MLKSLVLAFLLCGRVWGFLPASHCDTRRRFVHATPIRQGNLPLQIPSSSTSLEAFRVSHLRGYANNVSTSTRRFGQKLSTIRKHVRRWAKRSFLAVVLFLVVNFASVNPALARSGGRMGGSFKPRSPPISRSLPRSSSHYRSQPPRMIIHRRPHVHVHSPTQVVVGETGVSTTTFAAPVRRITMSDVVLLTGVGTVVSLNVMDRLSKDGRGGNLESALGPGVSVVSLTVAINVPDRDCPRSILARLSRIALTARTNSRKGVQNLITETALELLRQKDSIVSADSEYSHFRKISDAQREFNTLSIGGRSKYDEETGKLWEQRSRPTNCPAANVIYLSSMTTLS